MSYFCSSVFPAQSNSQRHGGVIPGVALVLVFLLGCSSGGTAPNTATCSATSACPTGLVCVMAKGLCALPAEAADMAVAASDLASSGSADLAVYRPISSPGTISSKRAVYATPTRVFFTSSHGEVITGPGTSWTIAANIYDQLGFIAGWGADKVWVGDGTSTQFLLSYKP